MSFNLTHVESNGSKNKTLPTSDIDLPIQHGLLSDASEYEIVPTGVALWNAHNLYQTLKKVETALQRIQFLRNQIARPVVLLALSPADLDRLRQRYRGEIRGLEKFVKRCYLKASSCGLRVIKISTILISNPFLRKGVEGAINATAQSCMLARELTTQTKEQLLSPRTATWKDKAHRLFNASVSTAGLIFGVLTVASSLGYVDEADPHFQAAKTASLVSTITSATYAGLQFVHVFAQRD